MMTSVEDIVRQAKQLTSDEQSRRDRELARTLLRRNLADIPPDSQPSLHDEEIDSAVDEARAEALRARGH